LFINHGIGAHHFLEDITDEGMRVYQKVMDVNFHAHVTLTHAALSTLKRNKGQIVCISSTAAAIPSIGRSAYSASKAAVNGFYGCLRQELEPHGVGITIYGPA
jgi:NAD(P)-dependent dehydrogenase (short-subunit alcohol dehydrogenase family)